MPALLKEEKYLQYYCRKLRDVSDVNLSDDRKVLGEYLVRLLKFARKTITHVSLKGLILYNFLKYQEEQGNPNEKHQSLQKRTRSLSHEIVF